MVSADPKPSKRRRDIAHLVAQTSKRENNAIGCQQRGGVRRLPRNEEVFNRHKGTPINQQQDSGSSGVLSSGIARALPTPCRLLPDHRLAPRQIHGEVSKALQVAAA
jgi:hypothetical protein